MVQFSSNCNSACLLFAYESCYFSEYNTVTLVHYSSVGQPGSSLAAPVAGGITALIAVLVAVIIIVFILLRYCMHSRQ